MESKKHRESYDYISKKIDSILHKHSNKKTTDQKQETKTHKKDQSKKDLKYLPREKKKKYHFKLQKKKTREKKEKPLLSINSKNITEFISSNIVEITLILIGLYFLQQPTLGNIKIAFTLALIGTLLLFIMEDEITITPKSKQQSLKFSKNRKGKIRKKSSISPLSIFQSVTTALENRIAIILISWTLLLFVITAPNQLEIFFILIFIGFLIVREFTDDIASRLIKNRLNIYIGVFLFAYVIVISEKIINILNM